MTLGTGIGPGTALECVREDEAWEGEIPITIKIQAFSPFPTLSASAGGDSGIVCTWIWGSLRVDERVSFRIDAMP